MSTLVSIAALSFAIDLCTFATERDSLAEYATQNLLECLLALYCIDKHQVASVSTPAGGAYQSSPQSSARFQTTGYEPVSGPSLVCFGRWLKTAESDRELSLIDKKEPAGKVLNLP